MALSESMKSINIEELGLHQLSDEELHNVQNTLLEMMKDIAAVFKKNNLKWCLAGGSVIGAVRHNGFIPWDDDIDIFMPRESLDQFITLFEKELGDKYELKLPGDKGYLYHFPQIHKKGTHVIPIQSCEESVDGLFIDVFPIETAPQSKFKRKLHGLRSTMYLFIDSAIRMKKCKARIFKYAGANSALVNQVNKRARFAWLFGFKSLEKWLYKSDKCFSKYKNKESDTVVVPSGRSHYFGELYEAEKMLNYVDHQFESECWPIPADPEHYLRIRYGDGFMTVPPVEKREKHVYIDIQI